MGGAFAFALALVAGAAQAVPSPTPDGAGNVAAEVDRIFEAFDSTVSPGCALAVARDGNVVYRRGYGMADLDHDVPIRPDSPFHVASVSKQFTAAAVLLLGQEGRLSLDDDVRKHVPELPAFGHPITLRQLIHHTSGLRDQWDLLNLAGWRYSLDLITDEDVLSVVTRQRALNFTPGERHLYCNTGYTLLAQVVARVSGRSFRAFTGERIFRPLGMERTHFRDDHAEIVKDQALGYAPAGGPSRWRLSVTNFDTVGATSLVTTAEDLTRWARNFDDPRVGGPELVRQMVETGRLGDGKPLNYASGLGVREYRGLPVVEHGGVDAGYRAHFLRFPNQRFAIACLCNASTAQPGQLARRVADAFLATELGQPDTGPLGESAATVPLAPERLSDLAGLYWSEAEEDAVRVLFRDGRLVAALSSEQRELRPTGEGTFRVVDAPAWVRFAVAGDRATVSTARYSDLEPRVFDAVRQWLPSPAELGPLAGTYRAEEIDPAYRIEVADGRLVLERLKAEPDSLEPIVADTFKGRVGVLRFRRSPSGQVTGFDLSTGRIRGMRFERSR